MTDQYKIDLTTAYSQVKSSDHRILYDKMKEGDQVARDQLIASCLPLVYDLAQKFRKNNRHIDLEDMIQHGNIALIRAVDGWDISRAKLSTVATWYVRNSLIDMIKESKYSIKNKFEMSRQSCDDMKKIRDSGSEDIETIRKSTGLTVKRIKLLMRIMSSKRIDYTVLNMRLHNQEALESDTRTNIDGCLAELIELVEETVEDESEKETFFHWLRYIHKNNKTRLTAEDLDSSVQEVGKTIRKTKKAVKEAAQARKELSHA
jgi:RNA polymerase sigma factor (sigma-70 family)